MAIFVSTTYLGDNSKVENALQQLEKLGIKNIEMGSNHAPTDIRKLNLRKDTTYIFHNYFPPKEKDFVLNLASQKIEVRKKSIEFIKNTINICNQFGIASYTIHPGFFADALSPHNNEGKDRNFDFVFKKHKRDKGQILAKTAKIIRDLYLFARENGVQLLIENQGSQTSSGYTIFDSPQELDYLKREVGDQLKYNFNLAHATLAGFNLFDETIFSHYYDNTLFFEVSEIAEQYDSHLPLFEEDGKIFSLLKKYAHLFVKKNIILEYRNVSKEKMAKSYDRVTKLLKEF